MKFPKFSVTYFRDRLLRLRIADTNRVMTTYRVTVRGTKNGAHGCRFARFDVKQIVIAVVKCIEMEICSLNGKQGFGETGFGEVGFGEAGFGETGFGEAGFGEAAGYHWRSSATLPRPLVDRDRGGTPLDPRPHRPRCLRRSTSVDRSHTSNFTN